MNIFLRFGWIALALSVGSTSVATAHEIKLSADIWCPYNCDPNSDKPGFMVEIARAILGPAGHTIKYVVMPWSRALTEARKGHIQGVIGAQPSEAPDLAYGSVPLARDDTGFAVRKGSRFRYDGPSSLDPYRLGAILDYNYDGGVIDAYLKMKSGEKGRIQLITGSDVGAANLRKLVADRIDVVIDSAVVLTYLVKQLGLEDKVDVMPLGHPTDIYVAFSPADSRSTVWADQLSSGLEALRLRGELSTILGRYGLQDGSNP